MSVVSSVTKKTLFEFINEGNRKFEIPCFQRNYSWEEQQYLELYEDIMGSYRNNKSYYLGNLSYYDSTTEQRLVLIDGQQRITTLFLLLCAIRDNYIIEGVNINADFLYSGDYTLKLKQNFMDANYFEKIISRISDDNSTEAASKINDCYNFFNMKLKEEKNLNVSKLYETIKKMEVVEIKLESDDLETVQTVFEKMNSAGKELSESDLIRNLLLTSNDVYEQRNLYEKYWIVLEKILGDENISQFSKDYLILKKYKDIKKEEIYRQFKEYYFNSNIEAEKILQDMIKYSKYYSLIKNYELVEEINDITHTIRKVNIKDYTSKNLSKEKFYNKIYWNLAMLNKLNIDEQCPFVMQLFNRLYNDDTNHKELIKILDLLADFMIRYRIVGKYHGGGALSTAIHDIMRKIDDYRIKCDYESILYELSNSPSPSSEFPTNEEFKKVLCSSVNDNYAKVLLYKLEYKTKNVPVDLKKIQIEHLMPQTLDKKGWWIKHLGGISESGESKAIEIHNAYLNCIGNLALISPGYNLENSNKPWDVKRKNLAKIQFTYTNSCSKYSSWKKKDICNRNEFISKKACEVIKGPLIRERSYKKNNNEKFSIYRFNNINERSFYYSKPISIIYEKNSLKVFNWREVIPTILKINPDINMIKLKKLIADNIVHKATKKHKNENLSYDPILSENKKYLESPMQVKINNYTFYVEGALSSERVLTYSIIILKYLRLIDKYSIETEDKDQ